MMSLRDGALLSDEMLIAIPYQTPNLVPSRILRYNRSSNQKGWTELNSEDHKGWTKVHSPTKEHKTTKTSRISQISVVQWNVWFDGIWLRERSEAIIAHLISLQPSIVALQEVTLTFWRMLLENPQIQRDYIVTDFQQQITETQSFYGVLILVQRELVKGCSEEVWTWEIKSGAEGMQSQMGRTIVGVDFGGVLNLRFATAHFESPPSHPSSRIHQFKLSSGLRTVPSKLFFTPTLTIVCGDTNCVTPVELPYAFDSSWQDAFEQTHPGEDGFTFTFTYPSRFANKRLDRLLYHSTVGNWDAMKCETFGRDLEVQQKQRQGHLIEDPRGRERKVWLSDHEGLRTVFGRTGKT